MCEIQPLDGPPHYTPVLFASVGLWCRYSVASGVLQGPTPSRHAGRADHPRFHRRRGLEFRRVQRAPADPRFPRPGGQPRRGQDPIRAGRGAPDLRRPRVRPGLRPRVRVPGRGRAGVGAVPEDDLHHHLGEAGEGQRRPPHLPAGGGELPGRHGGGGADQEQRPGVRGRDRAPPDRGRVPGVGERRPGDQPEGRDPQDLPQQLRRRGGRAGGGAGPDPGRRRHVPPQCRRRGAGRLPGRQGDRGGLRLRLQRRPGAAGAGPGHRERGHRSAAGVPDWSPAR